MSDPKLVQEFLPIDLRAAVSERPDVLEIIDVREPSEFAEVRIRGSKNLPLSGLTADTEEIDWRKEVVFVCRSGSRSLRVSYAFADTGKKCANLRGGIAGLAEAFPELLEAA